MCCSLSVTANSYRSKPPPPPLQQRRFVHRSAMLLPRVQCTGLVVLQVTGYRMAEDYM